MTVRLRTLENLEREVRSLINRHRDELALVDADGAQSLLGTLFTLRDQVVREVASERERPSGVDHVAEFVQRRNEAAAKVPSLFSPQEGGSA